MAEVTALSARAGSRFVAQFTYTTIDPETGLPVQVDTSGYDAAIQIRSATSPRRVIVQATAVPPPADAVFVEDEPGGWTLRLAPAITRALPDLSHYEIELTSKTDPNDVFTLCAGALTCQAQVVATAAPPGLVG